MRRFRRPRHLASATFLVAATLGSLAPPAAASTAQLVELSVAPRCKYEPQCPPAPPPDTALVYLGGGEANRVSLAAAAQQVRISDPGVRIEPGPSCSRVADDSVSCSVPRVLVYVATGGGADRVRSQLGPAAQLTVDGGAGNDVLVGGLGPDALLGGRGTDRLSGGGGGDRLFDASPRNPLRAGDQSPAEGADDALRGMPLPPGRARDSFDGGSGRDTVSYEGRSERLRIDLASTDAVAGARGERDSIRGVENATAGGGGDRLAGDRRANTLVGAAGDDRITGRAGADVLDGGEGRNVLSGRSGDDKLSSLGGPDRSSCGSGTDSVGDLGPLDFLAPDCEQPGFDFLDALLVPLEVRSTLPLREGRPPRVLGGRLKCLLGLVCQFRAEVRVRGPGRRGGTAPRRGTTLGSQSFTIGVDETKGLDLRLSAAGLRRLRRHRALRVSISIATQYSDGGPSSYLTLLRSPAETPRAGARER